jgi:hypothetical protein
MFSKIAEINRQSPPKPKSRSGSASGPTTVGVSSASESPRSCSSSRTGICRSRSPAGVGVSDSSRGTVIAVRQGLVGSWFAYRQLLIHANQTRLRPAGRSDHDCAA